MGDEIMYLNFVPILPSPELMPPDSELPLQPGQVLPARLMAAGDGTATLHLAGRTYSASGALPSETGLFWVQVQKVEPDRIQVKLLPTKFEPDLDAKLLLEALGLKANDEGETAVQQLLRWRLPLSQKLVQEFVNAAQAVPAKERPAFWASRAFLHSLALKDHPEKVEAALKYLLRRPDATPKGQEVINRTWPLYPDQEAVRILTFLAGQSEGEVFVIYRYQGQKSRSPDNWPRSLVIRLLTAAWGQVWILLFIQGRNLAARILAEDSSFLRLAQAAQPALKNRFHTMGWELAALTTAEKKITSIAELIKPPGPENYQPLDALV